MLRFWIVTGVFVAAALGSLAVLPSANAQCRTVYTGRSYFTPSYSYPTYGHAVQTYDTYVAPKVYKDVVYQAIIPVFQLEVRQYKTYGAIYTPPVPEPPATQSASPQSVNPQSQSQSDLQAVLNGLRAIDDRLKKLEGVVFRQKAAPQQKQDNKQDNTQETPNQSKNDKIPDVNLVAKNKCAACHDPKTADDAGGSLVLFDNGKLVKLTSRQAAMVLVKLAKEEMPPKNNKKGIATLTPEEYTAFVLALEKASAE